MEKKAYGKNRVSAIEVLSGQFHIEDIRRQYQYK